MEQAMLANLQTEMAQKVDAFIAKGYGQKLPEEVKEFLVKELTKQYRKEDLAGQMDWNEMMAMSPSDFSTDLYDLIDAAASTEVQWALTYLLDGKQQADNAFGEDDDILEEKFDWEQLKKSYIL